MVAVVLAVRVTDVLECSLKASGVTLGQANRQTEHAGRNERNVGAEPNGSGATTVTDDEIGVRCTGPAQRKGNESRKNEQSGCNHDE